MLLFFLDGDTNIPTIVPPAPSGLQLFQTGSQDIRLDWTDNSTIEDNFNVEMSTNGAAFVNIGTPTLNTFNKLGLTRNATYTFRVNAQNINGVSAYSNVVAVTIPLVDPVPSGSYANKRLRSIMR
jgi:hypothetical protein